MRLLLGILFTTMFIFNTRAGSPVSWSFSPVQNADGSWKVVLHASCEEGWHLYALTLPRDDGPFPTVIRIKEAPEYEVGAVAEPEPIEVEDPNFQMVVRYHGHETEFMVPVKRLSDVAFVVEGDVEYMCCNDNMCLPPVTVPFSVQFPAVK